MQTKHSRGQIGGQAQCKALFFFVCFCFCFFSFSLLFFLSLDWSSEELERGGKRGKERKEKKEKKRGEN